MPGIFSFFRKSELSSNKENPIKEAFARVKSDTTALFSWISYLRNKDLEKDRKISELMEKFQEQNKQVGSLETEILTLKSRFGSFSGSFPNRIRTESEPESEPKKRGIFERTIVAQTRPLKKHYIIRQMLNLIEKRQYTTKQIENIIVEEKRLCGRTAFYDYLRELKNKRIVSYTESGPKKRLVLNEKQVFNQVRFRT